VASILIPICCFFVDIFTKQTLDPIMGRHGSQQRTRTGRCSSSARGFLGASPGQACVGEGPSPMTTNDDRGRTCVLRVLELSSASTTCIFQHAWSIHRSRSMGSDSIKKVPRRDRVSLGCRSIERTTAPSPALCPPPTDHVLLWIDTLPHRAPCPRSNN